MLPFSIHQILDNNNMPSSKQIGIAIDIVFWTITAFYLVAWILSSNKSKKTGFWIVIGLLVLVVWAWDILSDFSESAHGLGNSPLPLASKIAIGIFFTILVLTMFKRDRTPKE